MDDYLMLGMSAVIPAPAFIGLSLRQAFSAASNGCRRFFLLEPEVTGFPGYLFVSTGAGRLVHEKTFVCSRAGALVGAGHLLDGCLKTTSHEV